LFAGGIVSKIKYATTAVNVKEVLGPLSDFFALYTQSASGREGSLNDFPLVYTDLASMFFYTFSYKIYPYLSKVIFQPNSKEMSSAPYFQSILKITVNYIYGKQIIKRICLDVIFIVLKQIM
jgi:hypothetical protein